MKNMTAHMNGSDTSSLCFSYDNLTLASRGGNNHVGFLVWFHRSETVFAG